MYKKVTFTLVLLFAASLFFVFNFQFTTALNPPATEWTKTYSGGNAYCVVQTKDGYGIAGNSGSGLSGGLLDGLIKMIKTNNEGNEIWSVNYPYYAIRDGDYALYGVRADSIVQTSDGNYVLGCLANVNYHNLQNVLMKIDSTGRLLWNTTYSYAYSPVSLSRTSVIQTTDGGLAWTGSPTLWSYGGSYIWLTKTNSFGAVEWAQEFGNIGEDISANSIVQSSDGGFVLAGNELNSTVAGISYLNSSSSFPIQSLLIKTDSAGYQIWNRTYGNFTAHSVINSNDGGYALAGQNVLVKTDSSGNLQWNKTYDFTISSLVQTNDGGYAMVGGNVLFKTDSSGNLQWFENFEASLSSVINTSDGGLAIAGIYSDTGGPYFWLSKISSPLTPTPTPTPTPATTPTPTPTPSPTPSSTSTPTATPTLTPSPTPTPTPTITPTPSPTPAPTEIPTPTPTPTLSPTPSPSPTPYPSPLPTLTTTPTATPTPTLSATPTAPTPSPSEIPAQSTGTPLYLYALAVIVILAISTTALIIKKKK